jgi:hypothetical protein
VNSTPLKWYRSMPSTTGPWRIIYVFQAATPSDRLAAWGPGLGSPVPLELPYGGRGVALSGWTSQEMKDSEDKLRHL